MPARAALVVVETPLLAAYRRAAARRLVALPTALVRELAREDTSDYVLARRGAGGCFLWAAPLWLDEAGRAPCALGRNGGADHVLAFGGDPAAPLALDFREMRRDPAVAGVGRRGPVALADRYSPAWNALVASSVRGDKAGLARALAAVARGGVRPGACLPLARIALAAARGSL